MITFLKKTHNFEVGDEVQGFPHPELGRGVVVKVSWWGSKCILVHYRIHAFWEYPHALKKV